MGLCRYKDFNLKYILDPCDTYDKLKLKDVNVKCKSFTFDRRASAARILSQIVVNFSFISSMSASDILIERETMLTSTSSQSIRINWNLTLHTTLTLHYNYTYNIRLTDTDTQNTECMQSGNEHGKSGSLSKFEFELLVNHTTC